MMPKASQLVSIVIRIRGDAPAEHGDGPARLEFVRTLHGGSAITGAANWCKTAVCDVRITETTISHTADRTEQQGGSYRLSISRVTGEYDAVANGVGMTEMESGRCFPVGEPAHAF
jgi:hypothetical protein